LYIGGFAASGNTVSATSWFSDKEHIRVYVGNDAGIYEYCWDAEGWYSSPFYYPGVHSSASSLIDSDGIEHIRVYLSMSDGSIVEGSWDSQVWIFKTDIDQFSSPVGVVRTTASTFWQDNSGGVHIHVFVHQNGYIWENCYDGSNWYIGEVFGAYGKQISITSWVQNSIAHMRAYVVNFDNTIHEICYDAYWRDIELNSIAGGVSTSTTSWLDSNGGIHIRTYVTSDQEYVSMLSFDSGSWWTEEAFN